MITAHEYLAIKWQSIEYFQKEYPNVNIQNLMKETWISEDCPFFYIDATDLNSNSIF